MSEENLEIFKKTIINFSRKNRNFIFAYFDTETDSYLTNHFSINLNNLPNLIVYDFINRGHFIDNSENKNEEDLLGNLKNVMDKLAENNLNWSYGNILQNFFSKFGINFSEKKLITILLCFVGIVLFLLIFSLFCCNDSEEISDDQKREFLEKLAYNEELSEEEKNMIVTSRNFNSYVKMGLENIVEAIKGKRDENDNNDSDNDTNQNNEIVNENLIEEEAKLEDNLNNINDIKEPRDKKND